MTGLSYEPAAALMPLEPLTGRWATQGQTVAEDGEPARPIVGIDWYEWMGGGRFLVHHVHVRIGDELVEAIEMIGEPDDDGFAMRSFDQTGAYAEMRATIDDTGAFDFVGPDMRSTLKAAADGQTMHARWERRTEAGDWRHWMDLSLTRLS